MVVKCRKGKPRFRFRKIKGGRQRLAFCNNKAKEIKTFKKGKVTTRKLNPKKMSKSEKKRIRENFRLQFKELE